MKYSREKPSDRYLYLQSMYRQMHIEGDLKLGKPAEVTFPGFSLVPQISRIKALIQATQSEVVLDYGSGKGRQYEMHELKDEAGVRWANVLEYWGIEEIVCYDPGYAPYSHLPEGKFDGVISTDVLEHCPEEDIPWIVEEMFGFAERFVFANVACYPAKKVLPNGENAHCTVKPPEWWQDIVNRVAESKPGIMWEFWVLNVIDTPEGQRIVEQKIGRRSE